ncbi:MAG TPA: hypothetical protein VFZ01_18480 [Geminicoccaceae bacterium]
MKILGRAVAAREQPAEREPPSEPDAPPVLVRRVVVEREPTIDLTRLRIFRNEMVIVSGFLLLLVLLAAITGYELASGVFERLAGALP